MRRWFSLTLLTLLAACGPVPAPTPPTPPPVVTWPLDIRVTDATGAPVADVWVRITDGPDANRRATSGPDGVAHWAALTQAGFTVCPESPELFTGGCVPVTLTRALVGADAVGLPGRLARPEKATGDALTFIQANFCNLRDSRGRVIFTPFLIALPADERADWYAVQRAAGSTHTVLSPQIDYAGSPIPGRDLLDDPPAFRAFVLEALETPAADGKGFRPILILDTGAANPRERIDTKWPPLINALRDVLPYVIVVPGWEVIKASDWTSADLSYALVKLHDLGVPHIWVHLSIGRASGASNPVEADDPWQGAEAGFWKSHGGEFAEGLLYQAEPLRDGDNPFCDPAQDACWLNRWADVVPRIGAGLNGWRIVHLALFENVAFYYYRGQASDGLVRDMATAGQAMCAKYGVTCGFGNGLPR